MHRQGGGRRESRKAFRKSNRPRAHFQGVRGENGYGCQTKRKLELPEIGARNHIPWDSEMQSLGQRFGEKQSQCRNAASMPLPPKLREVWAKKVTGEGGCWGIMAPQHWSVITGTEGRRRYAQWDTIAALSSKSLSCWAARSCLEIILRACSAWRFSSGHSVSQSIPGTRRRRAWASS